jgi:phosphoglycolate phosphatase-like HAD superfamily hydrolase
MFQQVLTKLEITAPERVIVVGDSPYDALAAKPLGLKAAGVLTGGFTPEELKAAGCDIILQEVAQIEQHLSGGTVLG